MGNIRHTSSPESFTLDIFWCTDNIINQTNSVQVRPCHNSKAIFFAGQTSFLKGNMMMFWCRYFCINYTCLVIWGLGEDSDKMVKDLLMSQNSLPDFLLTFLTSFDGGVYVLFLVSVFASAFHSSLWCSIFWWVMFDVLQPMFLSLFVATTKKNSPNFTQSSG